MTSQNFPLFGISTFIVNNIRFHPEYLIPACLPLNGLFLNPLANRPNRFLSQSTNLARF